MFWVGFTAIGIFVLRLVWKKYSRRRRLAKKVV